MWQNFLLRDKHCGMSRHVILLQVPGFTNIVECPVILLQVPGFTNIVECHAILLQVPGFTNIVECLVILLQVPGFTNIVECLVILLQVPGFTNIVECPVMSSCYRFLVLQTLWNVLSCHLATGSWFYKHCVMSCHVILLQVPGFTNIV